MQLKNTQYKSSEIIQIFTDLARLFGRAFANPQKFLVLYCCLFLIALMFIWRIALLPRHPSLAVVMKSWLPMLITCSVLIISCYLRSYCHCTVCSSVAESKGLDVYLPVKIHSWQLSIDHSSWKDEMKMVPLMEAGVFSIWNSRYNCDHVGLSEVLNNRMLGFWVVLFGACPWWILLCLVTSLTSRFVFSSSFSLAAALAFQRTVTRCAQLQPAPGAPLGWSASVLSCG